MGVRTKFYDTLERKMHNGSDILNTEVNDLLADERKDFLRRVIETQLKINAYVENLVNQSGKLTEAISDGDDKSTETTVEDDSTFTERVHYKYIISFKCLKWN